MTVSHSTITTFEQMIMGESLAANVQEVKPTSS
jgi:hypothetical protein